MSCIRLSGIVVSLPGSLAPQKQARNLTSACTRRPRKTKLALIRWCSSNEQKRRPQRLHLYDYDLFLSSVFAEKSLRILWENLRSQRQS
jgi:hypothetical protein